MTTATTAYKITGEGDRTKTVTYTPVYEEAEMIAQLISNNGYYPHIEKIAMCMVPQEIRELF